MGYNAAARASLLEAGAPIPETLVVGPGTDEPAAARRRAASELPLDSRMRWMVDFAEAEKVGMGIRIELPPTRRRFDTLLVFGVKTSLTPDAAATRLEALLDAHHYTRGLAFLAPGTPTNNTAEAARRLQPSSTRGGFNVEVAPPAIGNDTDCGEVARLVGIKRRPVHLRRGRDAAGGPRPRGGCTRCCGRSPAAYVPRADGHAA